MVYAVAPMRHEETQRDYREDVGDLVRRARERRGISQSDLAEALGLSRSTVIRYEKGEGTFALDDVPKLASLLGLTLGAFLTPPRRSRVIAEDLTPYMDEAIEALGSEPTPFSPAEDQPSRSASSRPPEER